MIRIDAALFCLLTLLGPPSVSRPPAAECPGCYGMGGTGSGGGSGCTIMISVVVSNGGCRLIAEQDPPRYFCRQYKRCFAEVTGTWSGLPANEEFEGCAEIDGVRYCVDPPPTTGSGTDSDTYVQPLNCVADNPVFFSLSFPGCGSATAGATCSECPNE